MNQLYDSEEKIRLAILRGSMEGECSWCPADIVELQKKLSYIDSQIRADPFYHSRNVKIRMGKELRRKISIFDPRKSVGFYTEINLLIEESWSWTNFISSRAVNIHFFIKFDGESILIRCNEIFTPKPKKPIGERGVNANQFYKAKAMANRFIMEGGEVPSQYLMLPSLIPNNIVTHRKRVLRYKYREEDE
jgi:hypothetical protein